MLYRDTILLTKKFTKVHLGTLLDQYGPEVLSSLFGTVYYFQYPDGYKKTSALTRGRPWYHINKSTGFLKKIYKKTNLRVSLNKELQLIEYNQDLQFLENLRKIQYYYKKVYAKKNEHATIIQKYVRRYIIIQSIRKAKQLILEDINLYEDPITTEPLNDPVIIIPDFKDGNYIIYNRFTISQMAKKSRQPVYTFFNVETYNDEICYYEIIEKDIFNNTIYKSPYTRREFTMNDVVSLKHNMIYKFAKLLK